MKIVDTREPLEIRIPLLERGWIQEMLRAGDYAFPELRVGIERKTISDLMVLPSTKESLQRLRMEYDIPILLMEGSLIRRKGDLIGEFREFTLKRLWNFLQTFQDWGIRIQLTTSLSHTIERLDQLYAYYQDPVHRSILPRKFSTDPRVLALCLIPGVSRVLAMELLSHFGSLEALARASPKALEEVRGIGERKAQDIYKFFK